jgi:hypothetical protein
MHRLAPKNRQYSPRLLLAPKNRQHFPRHHCSTRRLPPKNGHYLLRLRSPQFHPIQKLRRQRFLPRELNRPQKIPLCRSGFPSMPAQARASPSPSAG